MSNLWEKFDKSIDTGALANDVAVAAEGNMDFKEVPEGQYEVKVDKMEFTESKTGNPMLTIWFKILSGEFKNSKIFYNQVLHVGFGIHKANELMKALDSGLDVKFENFKQYDELIMDVMEAIDGKLEYQLKFGKDKKGYNTYEIEDVFEV